MIARPRPIAIVAFALVYAAGCMPQSYNYGRFREPGNAERPPNDVVFGEPDSKLDALAKVVETPGRILHLSTETPSRELTPETAERLNNYLQRNELDDLHIEIRHHDPAGQWRRLRQNSRISPLWRYTAGAMSLIGYTLFPGRVWGTNCYNPYTDSLSINSNRPLELLQQSAVAKEIRRKRWPGPYAAFTSLPGLALIRQTEATGDVVAYARAENDWETEKQAYRELYPRLVSQGTFGIGPTVSVAFGVVWWVRPILSLGGAVLGRSLGYVMEKRRERERSKDLESSTPVPRGQAITSPTPVRSASSPSPWGNSP